jgi:hypothetical protein
MSTAANMHAIHYQPIVKPISFKKASDRALQFAKRKSEGQPFALTVSFRIVRLHPIRARGDERLLVYTMSFSGE